MDRLFPDRTARESSDEATGDDAGGSPGEACYSLGYSPEEGGGFIREAAAF
jgi:hypothetical protein